MNGKIISDKILNYSGLVFLVCLLFTVGFYFGYKNAEARLNIQTVNQGFQSDVSAETIDKEIIAESVPGVYWIKPGEEPICPNTHPVKGTYNDNNGNFYTKENSRYDRIKPDICFATEEYAKNESGYIKKF